MFEDQTGVTFLVCFKTQRETKRQLMQNNKIKSVVGLERAEIQFCLSGLIVTRLFLFLFWSST